MSDNKSQNLTASIITSNLISPSSQTNSKEFKFINDEVEDNVQKTHKDDDDDDDDDDGLENGGWGDDFDDFAEDFESIKAWETLEFLSQIRKWKSEQYKGYQNGNDDAIDEISNVEDPKDDDSLLDNDSAKGGENSDVDDHNNDIVSLINFTTERNETGISVKDKVNGEIKLDKITSSIQTFSNGIKPSVNNIINQPSLSIPKLNVENRKRKTSDGDDETMLYQKTKNRRMIVSKP